MRGQYKCKVDNVQPEILRQLRKAKISYKPTHATKGFVDLVVGYKGKNYLFEIKNDHKQKLTGLEPDFHDYWEGQINIITSFDDIMKILNKE